MPYDERNVWIDPDTGIPDVMMPPGMGTPATPGYHPRPPAVPQGITPEMQRPIPQAPGIMAPGSTYQPAPQAPDMLKDPSLAGITAKGVSPPIPQGAVQQEWQKLVKPEMSGGDIAGAILGAPLTIPMGLIEELRGAFGGSTIAGWGAQAEARYNNPNFNESRAFGVPTAQPLGAGDRFLGVVTGRAQDKAAAGIAIRNEISRYNKQRTGELSNFKDVIDIYKGAGDLRTNEFKEDQERRYRDLTNRLGIQLKQSNLATQDMTRQNLGQQMDLRDITMSIKTMEEAKARGEQVDDQMLTSLYALLPGARGLTGEVDKLTRGAPLSPYAVGQLRTAQGEGERNQATSLGNVEKAATQPSFGTGLTPQQQQAIDDAAAARDTAEQARKDTAAALQAFRDQGEADKKAIRDREEINATLSDIDHAYAKRKEVEIQEPSGFFAKFGKGPIVPSVPDQIKALNDESMLLKSDVAAGKYLGKRGDALLRAQGLSAAPTDVAPLPSPTPLATPTPGLDARIGTMSSADKLAERLAREVQDTGIRPTPMATPKPAGEDARRENADKLSRFTTKFNAEWQRLHPSKPIGGEVYKREFKRNATDNHLTVESLD